MRIRRGGEGGGDQQKKKGKEIGNREERERIGTGRRRREVG